MRIHPAPQGSGEWLRARAGVITASELDNFITPTGKPATQRRGYLCRLAGEHLLGTCEELYESLAMKRGSELEDEARAAYALMTGETVTEAGLCIIDQGALDGRVAASPDGLCGEDGGLELKCPAVATHVGYIMDGTCPAKYHHQVQGCLFVTGRAWWDFMSYYPGLPPFIVRCWPDPTYQAALAALLPGAVEELDGIIARLEALK
jgi:hypothetical protein